MLSQNKKILVTAIALFIASFSGMLVFLEQQDGLSENGHTDVLHSLKKEDSSEGSDHQLELLSQEEPVFVTNAEGRFVSANEHFCTLLHLNCGALESMGLFDIVHPDDLKKVASHHATLVQQKEVSENIGPFRLQYHGSEALVLLAVSSITEKEHRYFVFTVQDITGEVEEFRKDSPDEDFEEHWIHDFYPKIKDIPEETLRRLTVEKIGYHK